MGSGESPRAVDGEEDPVLTRFGKTRFILDPRQCVLVEVAEHGVKRAASVGAEGVMTALALTEGAVNAGRRVVGHEAEQPEV